MPSPGRRCRGGHPSPAVRERGFVEVEEQ
jgi:hypothetical protein